MTTVVARPDSIAIAAFILSRHGAWPPMFMSRSHPRSGVPSAVATAWPGTVSPAARRGRSEGERLMEIVDAQVHSWEPVPTYPWEPVTASPHATGKSHAPLPFERVLVAMDAVGVDAALLHTSPNYREKRPDG